jgi:hypothetical protein
MGVARTFRTLELYDILVNLIPGTTILLAVAVVFEVEKYVQISGGIIVGVFLIVGFIFGHVVQAVASQLEGTPTLFGTVVRVSKGEEVDNVSIPITHVEESVWPMMKQKFSLPDEFENYGEMFRLLLSYIETTPATRALRFQALHSFHRSMWAVWYLVVGIVIVAIGLKLMNVVAVRSWAILGTSIGGALLGIAVFNNRKKKFNKRFIQYAIADFYLDQVDELKSDFSRAK